MMRQLEFFLLMFGQAKVISFVITKKITSALFIGVTIVGRLVCVNVRAISLLFLIAKVVMK